MGGEAGSFVQIKWSVFTTNTLVVQNLSSIQKLYVQDESQANSASLCLTHGNWSVSLKSTGNLLLF